VERREVQRHGGPELGRDPRRQLLHLVVTVVVPGDERVVISSQHDVSFATYFRVSFTGSFFLHVTKHPV
jgi:hypothetical protein